MHMVDVSTTGDQICIGDRAGELRVVLDRRGTAHLLDLRQDRGPVQRPARAGRERLRPIAPRPDDGRRPIRVVPCYRDHLEVEQRRDLPGDRRTDLG